MCLRPVRWFQGVPSPVKHPEKVDMVIFRENTEDVYAGKELEEGTPEAKRLIEFLHDEYGWDIRPDSGIGIKPVSETGSKRLVRAALNYAVEKGRKSVTLVHKGNIQKFTEGAFRDWGYELVKEEFADVAVGWDDCGGEPGDKILVKDTIADIFLQQVLTRPDEFDVIATTNLNGDYASDALAAQVGGIGIAPGGNINYVTGHGIFEATHGTAPKYAGQDKVNPGSVLLSGVLMLEHLGWQDAADDIVRALEATIADKIVTYDFARLMEGATEVKTSEFAVGHRRSAVAVRRRSCCRRDLSRGFCTATPRAKGAGAVKITVVGCGFYGSTLVQRIAEADYADEVVMTDIIEGKPQGLALDMMQSRSIEGFETRIVGHQQLRRDRGVATCASSPRACPASRA